ncbi:hypothetical protein VTL71DRAFT_12917 [Oculimacula yallundae]|uniref:Secreted peptide n=1 Tax=Oculimacula yallundae TaxID=86028 RepID=A0ABR4CPJ2_9HELO
MPPLLAPLLAPLLLLLILPTIHLSPSLALAILIFQAQISLTSKYGTKTMTLLVFLLGVWTHIYLTVSDCHSVDDPFASLSVSRRCYSQRIAVATVSLGGAVVNYRFNTIWSERTRLGQV